MYYFYRIQVPCLNFTDLKFLLEVAELEHSALVAVEEAATRGSGGPRPPRRLEPRNERLAGRDKEDAVLGLAARGHHLQLVHQEVHDTVQVLLPHLRVTKGAHMVQKHEAKCCCRTWGVTQCTDIDIPNGIMQNWLNINNLLQPDIPRQISHNLPITMLSD